jgi:hypothetical protein
VESEGLSITCNSVLLELAQAARRSLTIRTARYQGADPDHPDRPSLSFTSRFALRYGGIRQDQDDVRLPEVRAAFNSPFWPFVLATTSIGQEGVDFHWWCHAVVHWNLPANPVDFEQREGRVDRYKGHAVRRNVAQRHRLDLLADGAGDPWTALFAAAERASADRVGGLIPYWQYPGEARIERYVLSFPLSRDQARWESLRQVLALYRLAYGQPRQEDMIDVLKQRGLAHDAARIAELQLNLAPPGAAAVGDGPAATRRP